jgi:glycosyltransferase involved in cell wall biosynthesis
MAGAEGQAPSRPRRLLGVVHGPVFGGGLNEFVQLRGPFQRRGWETSVVVPVEGDAADRLRGQGVETVTIPLHRLRATPDPRIQARFLAGFAPEVRALRKLIRARGIDLVQAHGDTNPHAAIAGHLEGVAVVWYLYDTRTPVLLRRMTMPLVTRLADSVITTGQALAGAYPGVEKLGERHVVVFPPVDAERFRPDETARRSARAELGVPDDAFVIGAVGNRNPSKGYEWLVRALARARQNEPSLHARVLGAPSPAHAAHESSILGEAAALGLEGAFTVRDAGTRVPALMPGFDALVLSSVPRSEGMPTVILEAMACGLPVIATDVGAVDEVLVSGETGLLVPPENTEDLAAAISRLAREPRLAAEMGAKGRQLVEEHYGLDQCADRRLDAYGLALAHRRARGCAGRVAG